MTKGNFIESFGVGWDPLCCLPPIDSLRTADEKLSFQATVTRVEAALRSFHPLALSISKMFHEEKYELQNPTIRWCKSILTTTPKDRAYFAPKANLYAEIFYDPLSLDATNLDQVEIGKLAVRIAESTLRKLSDWSDFPTELVTSALRKFEAANYTYTWDIKRALIDKKLTQIIVSGEISASKTTCTFEVSREGNVLYASKVWEADGAQWQLAQRFNKLSVVDGQLIVGVLTDRIVDAFSVDLDSLPADAKHALITKSGSLKR
ncbi:hypothetical protein DS901_02555 [Loktanella sp. D2R18]|uniref:hypothetical protein n=1 Tax=Rhodobacterales TaxID=204455 RepID=UPI000DE864CE|nr:MULTISPECIES: hypothetical protein [Rhodobacterales]MDO6591964.1 hypothetical protein [Yoonia sp. 1_MG-2023]RBW45664.1 hypothetical protein DS901_02555 [Loktanella sp. D2R18]